jgi:hypothetical protein
LDAVFKPYISPNGLEFQQQARQSEKYVLVFGLSRVQNAFPNLQKGSGNWQFCSLKKTANFPQFLGFVEVKNFRVIKPETSGSIFYNYKDFSVVLMAVANSNYRFMYVEIGSYGKYCDSTIFKRSTLWTSVQTNLLELPGERPFSGTECPNVPHYFVGDEGFALNRYILRPFGESNLSFKKKSVQLSLVQSTKVCGMCFGNFEQ